METTIKIDFTKKEYRKLLDMVCLSDYIMHAHKITPGKFTEEHRILRKKVLSYYKEMSAEDLIKRSSEGKDEYYELFDYDDYLQDSFINPYDEDTFLDMLTNRLTDRDIANTVSNEEYSLMTPEERQKQFDDIKEKYVTEFREHGLENLIINYANKQ